MKNITRITAVAVMAATAILGTGQFASAQTDAQFNRHLVKRYGCTTSQFVIFRLHPASYRGWLVVDFPELGLQGRWTHVSRDDYPQLRDLRADALRPMAICKR